ncbi:type I-E CRISPR-associated protein Cas6/Cse3/CasE [Couchioplanes caeruleus]|nr:type I-E CRISPR-associated protein Cas6/Cse3/CasE [Couchioplanes caeruleus]ROP28983.1 CRISPR system Cascade subunit CasE [Couchioplanes caeruleus]
MFLTRLRLNPARRDARKLLGSPQVMHAAVLAGFPRPQDQIQPHARTLWRLDHGTDTRVTLYVVSPGKPDLTHLVEQAGWPTADTWRTKPYRPFLDTLEPGQRWAFRLTANPVRNGRPAQGGDTQRYGHVTVDHQIQWLLNRQQRNGFAIAAQGDGRPNLALHRRQTLTFAHGRGRRPVTLATATFGGVLTIEDGGPFRAMLMTGIGHARAYGCGLLTLAPLSPP